ncbi:MAG: SCP2 sterol-binding domain-containing protein [Saprospiraceae bacterium]|nr:SCP2 sterol-binding domain-containing protein [Saprospiraceae bacterium]MBK6564522.1 SCP2 sterol-binding domain-containing protein [Saprospiraceae bacterium]MBK6782704.1 SCP2 sterol-binding domain-containing protein [Saprospiraceae bacterium]MBK7523158.1 SCP2 sterol-binding domain-containing protein [Saprospiraceae bacterium]MBK8371847.1 SCP2 sterol-binding domain-containing protein [Saprospiraceae bacterium]
MSNIFEAISAQAANVAPFGAKLKFVLGEEVILIDGTGTTNVVSNNDEEAGCTISTDVDTFMALKSGELNPMMAVMSGKVKIKGDMGLAMKLQSLIS